MREARQGDREAAHRGVEEQALIMGIKEGEGAWSFATQFPHARAHIENISIQHGGSVERLIFPGRNLPSRLP